MHRVTMGAAIALLAMVESGAQALAGATDAACPAGTIDIAPGDPVQQAVEQAGEGARFCLKTGIHRMQAIRPKTGQRFYGEYQAVLNGSRLLDKFVRRGAYWSAHWPGPYGQKRGDCLARAPTCNKPEQIFFDGQPLLAAAGKDQLAPEMFFLDPSEERVYLADDPVNHVVEATAATVAFEATAPGVLVSNLIIEKYASGAQDGAIQVQTPLGNDWTVEHCELRLNSGGAIAVGNRTRVRDCDIHHNGQIGVTGVGDGVVIADNEVWSNNTRGFQFRWEAGGIKLAESKTVTFRGNRVHDNAGPGIWCDINCDRTVFEYNTLMRNEGPGIYYEISSRALIQKNYLRHNGIDGKAWFWGVNILVAGSEQVSIRDNIVDVIANGCGIVLTHQSRPFQGSRGTEGLYKTRDNAVRDNITTFEASGCAGAASDVERGDPDYAIIETGDNVFDHNTYRMPHASGTLRFEWGHAVLDWRELASRGVERDGRLIRY